MYAGEEELVMSYNEELQRNNDELQSILQNIKEMPGGTLASRLSLGIHTDGMMYVFVDGQPAGVGIELPSGGIAGYVDSANNIIITSLPDGDYTVKYEMDDGSTIDIGSLVLGADEPDVPAPSYTNLAEPNPDNTTDFSIWCSNARLSGDGVVRESDGYTCTNFIALTAEDVIRVRGFKVERLGLYDADKTILPLGASDLAGHAANNYIYGDYSQTDDATTFTIRALTPAYVRLSGWVNSTADAVVITKNEEIT